MKKVTGHTRLYRREATYYHRAKVPQDIVDSHGKREEKFSLKTNDDAEALRLVRIAAVEVDKKFDDHRAWLKRQNAEPVAELSPEQLKLIRHVYYQHLLDEDEELREAGFANGSKQTVMLSENTQAIDISLNEEDFLSSFEERQETASWMDEETV